MRIQHRQDNVYRHATSALLCVALALASTGVAAQEKTKLYSVASIAASHSNESTRRYFARLSDDFSKLQSAAGTNARFLFSTSQQINAFATIYRGDHIVVVNNGLLAYFRGDRDAVSAVLAHELGHVRRNHVVQGTQAQAAIQFIAGIAGLLIDLDQARRGHDSRVGLGRLGGEIGGALVSKAYTRDQEREADADSVELLIEAGIHPKAAARAHKVLAAAAAGSEPPLLFASHPPSSERVANISRSIEESATRIAARIRDPEDLARERFVVEQTHRAAAEERRLAQMAERVSLQAKADEDFAIRQNAAIRLEQEVLPSAATGKPVSTVAQPEGDCRPRGPNKRMCSSVDPAGRPLLKSCELSGDAWECRTLSGGG